MRTERHLLQVMEYQGHWMALLAGRNSLVAIHRYGQFLSDPQRRALGWPEKKHARGRKAPSYTAIRNLLQQLDPGDFAKTLSQWLEDHQGELPHALTLGGKWIRDRVLGVGLSEHGSGVPVAIAFAGTEVNQVEQKREGEQTVARKLYEQCNLNGAVVTADALCNSQRMRERFSRPAPTTYSRSSKRTATATKQLNRSLRAPPFLPTPKNPMAATGPLKPAP